MYTKFIIPFFLLFIMGCSPDAALQERISFLEKELDKASQVKEDSPQLIHTVFFNWKENITEDDKSLFHSELGRLAKIESVNEVNIAYPKNTGDKRLRSDYDIVLHVLFDNEKQLTTYQADSIHLDVKGKVGRFLKEVPIVYDFEGR